MLTHPAAQNRNFCLPALPDCTYCLAIRDVGVLSAILRETTPGKVGVVNRPMPLTIILLIKSSDLKYLSGDQRGRRACVALVERRFWAVMVTHIPAVSLHRDPSRINSTFAELQA